MTRKSKKVLITILSTTFFIVAIYFIITAQGLSLDLKHLKFIKTGGLYLKFEPTDVIVKINNKIYKNRSGFRKNEVLIKKLIPKNYEILVYKDGYQNWQKELTVKPGLVTSARQVRLWPKSPITEHVAPQIKDFWLTSEGPIYQNLDDSLHFKNYTLRGKKIISTDNHSGLIITTDFKNNFLINLGKPTSATNIDELFNSLKQRQLGLPGVVSIKEFFIHPFSDSKIILATQKAIYALDFEKIELEELIATAGLKITSLNDSEILTIDKAGNLITANLVFKRNASTSIKMTDVKKITAISDGGKIFFLTKDGALMLLDRPSQKLEEIASGVLDFYPETNGKRIAFISKEQKLKIYYLENYELDFRIPAGSFSEVTTPNGLFSNFSWLNNAYNYFIAKMDESLMVSEADPRWPQNSQILFSGVKKYILDKNQLYILEENNELIKTDLNI